VEKEALNEKTRNDLYLKAIKLEPPADLTDEEKKNEAITKYR
jgi:hypothetical protein